MAHPKSMRPPHTPRVVRQAKSMLVMPGANALTRALTATILERHGLLDPPGTAVVPISQAKPIRAAVRQKAAALRHEVEQLRAQAAALCLEAEDLCKPHRR